MYSFKVFRPRCFYTSMLGIRNGQNCVILSETMHEKILVCELFRPRPSAKYIHTGQCRVNEVKSVCVGLAPSDARKLLDTARSNNVPPKEMDDDWATMPYPKGSVLRRDQSQYAPKSKIDPRDMSIITFPGQGTQFVGMGKSLLKFPIARDLYEGANEILGYDLLRLCLQGPKEELDKTVHAQPAIMVTSLAALERLKEERPSAIENCAATAGFSLGEITALVFSGALSFEKGLRLLQVRAEAMQLASDTTPGGMMTVLYGPDSKLNYACVRAKEWCIARGIEDPHCEIASYMFPHCKVVAGHIEALKFLQDNADEFKLRRLKRLPVSGAFHTALMLSAVEPFRKALHRAQVQDPLISVHSNIDGKRYRNASHILRQLPKQIVMPVKWEQTLHILYERSVGENFPRTFECGPGTTLRTLLKNVNAKAWNSCVSIEA